METVCRLNNNERKRTNNILKIIHWDLRHFGSGKLMLFSWGMGRIIWTTVRESDQPEKCLRIHNHLWLVYILFGYTQKSIFRSSRKEKLRLWSIICYQGLNWHVWLSYPHQGMENNKQWMEVNFFMSGTVPTISWTQSHLLLITILWGGFSF